MINFVVMKHITLIGAGNLATQLGQALVKAGFKIDQVFSRTEKSACVLAKKLGAEPLTCLNSLRDDADVYIFSVKDSVLCQLIMQVCKGREDKLFLHTAGSMSIDCFKDSAQRYGVFYPMQTFSKTKNVSFENIPIFIEGNSEAVEEDIRTLAESIAKRVIPLSSEKRKYLHLAAVWACNFTNHCYSIASDILSEQGIPFDVMLPLIDETANKIHTMSPLQAQTGPAVRWDQNVIDKQMALMESHPSLQAIYERLSNDIHSHNK